MSPAGRLEWWRNAVTPSIRLHLENSPKHPVQNSAEGTDFALLEFDAAMERAKKYRGLHLGEDKDALHAGMAHEFIGIGVLPLDAIKMIAELFSED